MKKRLITLRSVILVFLTHNIALPLLKKLRKPNSFLHTKDTLKGFGEGTLGKDLYWFLENRNLPLLNHYARHDLKHILLEYDTTDEGEVCLQSFMLGNGRISFPVLATVVYGLMTMPEHWKQIRIAYNRGRQAHSIHNWAWNEIVHQPTLALRNKIFIKF